MRRSWLALGCAIALAGCGDDEFALPREPHAVVLIDIGGASAESLSAALAGEGSSLHAVASSGVVLEQAFAQSSVARSGVASLLTGLYPSTHGVQKAGDKLDESIVTLPQAFDNAGFATAAFSTAGDLGTAEGLDRGFGSVARARGDELTETLREFLDDAGSRPFFLLLHTDLGYALGSKDRDRKVAERIEAFDEVLGDLRSALDAKNRLDSTTFLITADRTLETLAVLDTSSEASEPVGIESTQVPFVVATPGLARRADHFLGDPSSDLISAEVVDVMPTLLDLAGVPVPDLMQGQSLRRVLEGSSQERHLAFSELRPINDEPVSTVALAGYQLVAVGQDRYLVRLADESPVDLASSSLMSSEPLRAEVLARHLDEWRKQLEGGLAGAQVLGSEELEALQNLGYIQ